MDQNNVIPITPSQLFSELEDLLCTMPPRNTIHHNIFAVKILGWQNILF